ncbi:hypothetical protein HNV11_21370 [Spirosoma taeanense]|uniref:Uncharacterized protein n=1 Tax=Spirosoma taeanense TaxID=2735870 RepID=A0A6M5YCC3_9BACT|nr:hypothetical protein [Spirosoma taeanense]QJW91748.1 hypothetical protein HNV11_21370 [Spirosoma taeanense]
MKTLLKALGLTLISVSGFAQSTPAKSDTTLASPTVSTVIGYNSAGRLGHKLSDGNFSPFALQSEVVNATASAVTSVNGKGGPKVTLVTTDVPEGTNQYFTTARSNAAGDSRYAQLSGSYANPAWLTSLAFSKVTNKPTTLAGYGITDADSYQTVDTYAAMNALTFSANVSRRVLVTSDERYGKSNQWYMVWADSAGVMHADKIVTISEK